MEAFEPRGTGEWWWATDAPQLRAQHASVAQAPYERVHVVLRGEAGPEGRYGQMGAYTREIPVEKVLQVRPARQGDCG